MPYANNQGVRIRYEVEGNGPPLVLVHGLAGYLEMWRELGYVDSLKERYRLIPMDIRGHGGSGKPHDSEAYKLELLVADVVAVMDDLKISKAHYLGYSAGGRIGFGLAKCAPERFRSFIIGGAFPYEFSQDSVNGMLQLLKMGMKATADAFEMRGLKTTPQMKASLLANDAEALAAFMSSSMWRVGLEDALPNMTVPCLFFVGEADPNYEGAKRCADCIRNAEFISFPNRGHLEVISQSHLALPHIIKFLEKLKPS